MKYLASTVLIFVQTALASQNKTASKDSIVKNDMIYFYSANMSSTTNWTTYSGRPAGSATSRSLMLRFKVGLDGDVMRIGRKGKNLRNALEKDNLALNELERAYRIHLRKKRICNTLEVVSYLATFGSAALFFVGLDGEPQMNGLTVAGGVGTVAGFTSILIFKNRTDKHLDDFAASVEKAVDLYNANLLKRGN